MSRVLAALLPIALPALAAAQTNADLAKALVEAINTQDQKKIEVFVTKSFSPKTGARTDPTGIAKSLLSIAKQGAPFTIGDTVEDKPASLIVRIKGRMALELEMKLEIDPDDHTVLSLLVGPLGSQIGTEPKTYTEWKDLTDLIAQIKADRRIPALCAGVVKGGVSQVAVTGERETGKPDKVQPADRWLIGSVTKAVTATMVARLVDQGLLRWDTTLGEALPETPMRPEYKAVTLYQLLRHRAGVPQDLTVDDEFIESAVGGAREPVEVREKYARDVLAREPIAKPDEQTLYSNAGYSLAGHIAEVVAKKPYEQLMRELVFAPLHMGSAQIGVPGAPGNPGAEGQVMGHHLGAEGAEPGVLGDARLTAMFAPAGLGVSMSVEDLLKFVAYHLKGLRGDVSLMSAENFKMLHDPAGGSGYACGWMTVQGVTTEPYIGHNGSDGTFRAEVAIWPERDLAVVSIMNLGEAREPAPPLQVLIAAFERYVGKSQK